MSEGLVKCGCLVFFFLVVVITGAVFYSNVCHPTLKPRCKDENTDLRWFCCCSLAMACCCGIRDFLNEVKGTDKAVSMAPNEVKGTDKAELMAL